MNWEAAKSYNIGYNSINRFLSIVFIHNYFLTWSISLIISLILPLLFIFVPSSLQTTRTTYFLLICIVCLSNIFCLYFQVHMISGLGEPILSYHTCRFIVYLSTFAKPIGIYLTFLFSIERLISKIISKLFLHTNNYRQLFHRLFQIIFFFEIIFIFSYRLYEILKLITKNQLQTFDNNDQDYHLNIIDTNRNLTDRNITFQYCFKSMNIDTYAQILSFYVVEYWYEYTALIIIILIFIIFIIQQYRTSSNFSINTKFYICLTSCLILSEFILCFCHLIVDDIHNNGTDIKLTSLQFMLFGFQFRCIFLPVIICLTLCYPLKQLIYEFFILQPYTDNINENDDNNNNNNNNHHHQSESFSNSYKIKNRFQKKFAKNNKHDNDQLQNDFNNQE